MLSKIFSMMMILLIILSSMSMIIKTKLFKMREKTTPFECGFDPQHKMRTSFSLRFFLITVVFLIFDIEMIVMLPISISSMNFPIKFFLENNMIIFFLLTSGLIFEWSQGALDWYWVYI